MATCLEAKELNEMRERAEAMARLVSVIVSLPFRFFTFIYYSYKLFIKMSFYFRAVSISNLAKCCKDREQVCIDCLTKIYEFEQEMLHNSRDFTNYRFVGWGYQRIVDEIEDRSEILILSIDRKVIDVINNYIDKLDKGGINKSNWQEQINAL